MDVVDDVGVEQHAVAIGEGEDRVEMHRGAQLRHRRHDHPLGRPLLEQRRRELADRLARGALAHADQHVALADRHHVAALERGQAMVLRSGRPTTR